MSNNNSFEENLKEIEQIINTLEKGDITLEESIEIYKKGIQKLKECNDKIERIEKELKIIKVDELE